jgi:hypothetical protein
MTTSYSRCPKFRIDDAWKPYRDEVQRYLDLISTTFAGRTLFKFIAQRATRSILIKPNFSPPVDATTAAENDREGYTRNALVMARVEMPDGTPVTLPDGREIYFPTGDIGTGRGTNATIEYHPAMWRQLAANLHQILPGAGPGEILYHELVHAMRKLHGKTLRDPVPAQVFLDDFDEFCSIVAANMYRSERGFSTLRLDHHGYSPMNPIMAQSTEFYKLHENNLKQWFTTQRDFCVELAGSNAKFNPLVLTAMDLGITVHTSMSL